MRAESNKGGEMDTILDLTDEEMETLETLAELGYEEEM
jgi:hypothetical protein